MIDKTIISETESAPLSDTTYPCPICKASGIQQKVIRTVQDHYGTCYIHIAILCQCSGCNHLWYHHLNSMLYAKTLR